MGASPYIWKPKKTQFKIVPVIPVFTPEALIKVEKHIDQPCLFKLNSSKRRSTEIKKRKYGLINCKTILLMQNCCLQSFI